MGQPHQRNGADPQGGWRQGCHAIGTPLITNADGTSSVRAKATRFGWTRLSAPYAIYQFWLDTADADVVDRLKVFTFLSRAEIEQLERAVAEEPFRREAQRTLAYEVTALIHGAEATGRPSSRRPRPSSARATWAGQDRGTLGSRRSASSAQNTTTASSTTIAQALVDTELTKSLGEARRAVAQGGVYVNNAKVEDAEAGAVGDHLLAGRDGRAATREEDARRNSGLGACVTCP